MKRFLIVSLFLVVSSHFFYSCTIGKANKTFEQNVVEAPYDVIIVPGIPYNEEDSTWGDVMKIRVYWSRYLYENDYTKNVMYSGSAVYTPFVESEVMKLYGEALGIPSEVIYTETNAEHSTENLYYGYQLAKDLGFEKIAVATDPFQSAMLMSFAKRNEMDVAFMPIVIDTLEKIDKINPEIDPTVARVDNFVSIVDRESMWKRWMGTMGKNIKERPNTSIQ